MDLTLTILRFRIEKMVKAPFHYFHGNRWFIYFHLNFQNFISWNWISPSSRRFSNMFNCSWDLRSNVMVFHGCHLSKFTKFLPPTAPRRRRFRLWHLFELSLQVLHLLLELDVLWLHAIQLKLERVDVFLCCDPTFLERLRRSFKQGLAVGYQWLVPSFCRVFERDGVGQRVADFHLLREEYLNHHPQREPFILSCVDAGINGELLAVHYTAESLPFVLRKCRMGLHVNWYCTLTHLEIGWHQGGMGRFFY